MTDLLSGLFLLGSLIAACVGFFWTPAWSGAAVLVLWAIFLKAEKIEKVIIALHIETGKVVTNTGLIYTQGQERPKS